MTNGARAFWSSSSARSAISSRRWGRSPRSGVTMPGIDRPADHRVVRRPRPAKHPVRRGLARRQARRAESERLAGVAPSPARRALRARLRLQTSDRSSFYFRLFWPGPYPEWSGIARGVRIRTPTRRAISCTPWSAKRNNCAWPESRRARAQAPMFPSSPPTSLVSISRLLCLVGSRGASHRPAKRWPVERFAALATELAGRGMVPVVLGVAAEGARRPDPRTVPGRSRPDRADRAHRHAIAGPGRPVRRWERHRADAL